MSSRLGDFANIYDLLDESDSSGIESGKKAKEAVEQKKAAAAAALAPTVTAKPANTQGQKPAGRSPRTDRPRGPRPDGAARPEGERRPRPQGERRPRTEGDKPRRPRPAEGEFAESGQAAARGEPRAHLPRDQVRGPRPDRGYERRNNGDQDTRPGKREFDRRSGTGRGKETAKGGAGAGNWGSEDAEAHSLEGQSATTAAAVAEGQTQKEGEEATAETTAAAPAETTEAAAPVDNEPPVRTLSAYLAERKSTSAAQASRKAGDGEDSSAYKNYQPFKKEEESLFAVEKTAKVVKTKEKESKEKKVSADQVLRFQQEKRDREDRGDRGTRGRGGRGGQGGQRRGGNSQGSALNFTDASAFPGLSTKA